MHWIAPSEKNDANGTLENRLWESADQFRANSGLKSKEYSAPVLGLELEIRHGGKLAQLR
jgi:type I restriction enzyme M protein